MKFTIEQIRTYLLSQDSMGDALYNLSEQSISNVNNVEKRPECSVENCPECSAPLEEKMSGIKCTECNYTFCL